MNPFINPYFLFQILKSYLIDTNRLHRMTSKSLKKFQDISIKQTVKYAYDVPLYKNKYKECDVHPDDINGIVDLQKLPFITKDDIRKNSPNGIISPSFNKEKAIVGYTSGTTGSPTQIYDNMYSAIKWLCGGVRIMKEHNINWRKTKITAITDLSENSIERKYIYDGIISNLKPFFTLDNLQILDAFYDPKKTIKKINSFQPEYISGNPGMFKKLAQLKRMGYGKDIHPRCMTSSGAILDNYLKKNIEETFETQVIDAYGATEVGPIAYQCKYGMYHINSDLIYLEVTDDNGECVSPGNLGHVVATRLYGKGTPIIRYTGLDDFITTTDEICDCGLTSKLIKEIHGRETQSIVLPDNKILLPSSLAKFYGELSLRIDTDKIDGFQLIQQRIDKIEIRVLIEKDLRNTAPSIEEIFSVLQKRFKDKFGSNIKINVKEIKTYKPQTPSIVSKVDKSKIKKKLYI